MKRAVVATALALGAGSPALFCSAPALAAEAAAERVEARHTPAFLPGSDGVYGRLDGSLALGLGAGAELEDGEPRGALRFSAHYLWTAGVYARYSDAFGSGERRPSRVLSFGVDLRPLFLPRFALDLEQGPALLDLALDSLSLTAGGYFAKPLGADFADERGFETGLGFGVPLLGAAQGPWLDARAERRFPDRGASAWLFTLQVNFQVLTWSTTAEAR
ncbi:MAG TPA: hypothetical protein VNG33_05060 [Polyangiaceae bacterium]|nr:hypothetical protein [Polyangiaceae bacterium]